MLIENGVRDVNIVGDDGVTPTWVSAQKGDAETLALLIKHGGNVDLASSEFCISPLGIASDGGHWEAVRTLLANGADANKADDEGQTPLIAAAGGGHVETLKVLLDGGGDLKKATKDNTTAMYTAASGGHTATVRQRNER